MSEQEEQIIETVQSTDQIPGIVEEVREEPKRAPRWIAPTWFLLGVVAGAAAFAIYSNVTVKPAPEVDSTAMRGAARQGVFDAIATLNAPNAQSSSGSSNEPVVVDPSKFTVRAANRAGNPNAKVTVIEFSDFQCPYCERFYQTVEARLRQTYVDAGKAIFIYKHSAFLGQESVWAAQAAECAADQGKFWEFHDLLFDRQNGENQGAFTKDKLLGFAQEMKLNMSQFEPCLKNDETLSRVQTDTQEGEQAGVRGTPTFFINGQQFVGAQPFEAFQAAIDKALTP